MQWLKRLWQTVIVGNFGGEEDTVIKDLSMEQLVDQAKQDWWAAKNIFDEATDKDLVDYAIYEMEAAERKFMHLLKKSAGKKSGR